MRFFAVKAFTSVPDPMTDKDQTEPERWEQVGASPLRQSRPRPDETSDNRTRVRIALALEYIAGRVGQIRRRLDEDMDMPDAAK